MKSKKLILSAICVGLLGAIILRRKAKANTASSVGKNPFREWLQPIPNVKVSSNFGYRTNPVSGARQFHNGIDLPTPVKTPVKCPFEGIVIDVYSNKEGGNQLLVKHPNGMVTGYAHLSMQLVKKGEKVKKSQVIALSGNSGQSTGPHLHFTLKNVLGSYQDPGLLYSRA